MNHYETPAYRIGKCEWRMIVTGSIYGGRCTDYEWRLPDQELYGMHCPAGEWKSMTAWPRYDGNDGMYSGCPRTLRRIYERHKSEIKTALEDGKVKETQASLF